MIPAAATAAALLTWPPAPTMYTTGSPPPSRATYRPAVAASARARASVAGNLLSPGRRMTGWARSNHSPLATDSPATTPAATTAPATTAAATRRTTAAGRPSRPRLKIDAIHPRPLATPTTAAAPSKGMARAKAMSRCAGTVMRAIRKAQYPPTAVIPHATSRASPRRRRARGGMATATAPAAASGPATPNRYASRVLASFCRKLPRFVSEVSGEPGARPTRRLAPTATPARTPAPRRAEGVRTARIPRRMASTDSGTRRTATPSRTATNSAVNCQWTRPAPASRTPVATTPRRPSAARSAHVAAATSTPETRRLSPYPTAISATFTDPPPATRYTGNDHRGSSRADVISAPAARPMITPVTAGTTKANRNGEAPRNECTMLATTGNPGRSALTVVAAGTPTMAWSPDAWARLLRQMYFRVSLATGVANPRSGYSERNCQATTAAAATAPSTTSNPAHDHSGHRPAGRGPASPEAVVARSATEPP